MNTNETRRETNPPGTAALVTELRHSVDLLRNERDAARDANAAARIALAASEHIIGELLALVRTGAGEDSTEYTRALEIIGAPPAGDISDPAYDDDNTPFPLTGWVTQTE